MMDKFLDYLRESIITQAVITVLVVGAYLYLVIAQLPVPSDLTQLLTLVVGFYFGSKVGYKQGEQRIARYLPKRSTDQITEGD